jgi:predicted ATPase
MRFVVRSASRDDHEAKRPFITLTEEDLDDYGFFTLYLSELHLADGTAIELGQVKILRAGQRAGRTRIPAQFEKLDQVFCSVGQAPSYYENLSALLTPGQRQQYLRGLRDAAVNTRIRRKFAAEDGFELSLVREGSANLAIEDAPRLIEAGSTLPLDDDLPLDFSFNTSVGGDPFRIDFDFNSVRELPGRMNAIIGYNGTGKTQLLANLAMVAHADLRERDKEMRHRGALVPAEIRFGAIVAVSYSAFDTFDLPDLREAERDLLSRRGDVAGYVYCGLREYTGIPQTSRRLKTPAEIVSELKRALKKISAGERSRVLRAVLKPLYAEPSFQRSSAAIEFFSSPSTWEAQFQRLSTGHQISLNILVQLVAHLERRSLVLIDEPESHLHPPLLAALLSGVSIALERNSSFAVIATHSPVVLQEVAKRYVRTISRAGRRTTISSPNIETFGENLGALTRHVFHLDNTSADYEGVLSRLAQRYTPKQIEDLFGGPLSAQARAILNQHQE